MTVGFLNECGIGVYHQFFARFKLISSDKEAVSCVANGANGANMANGPNGQSIARESIC